MGYDPNKRCANRPDRSRNYRRLQGFASVGYAANPNGIDRNRCNNSSDFVARLLIADGAAEYAVDDDTNDAEDDDAEDTGADVADHEPDDDATDAAEYAAEYGFADAAAVEHCAVVNPMAKRIPKAMPKTVPKTTPTVMPTAAMAPRVEPLPLLSGSHITRGAPP